MSIMTMRWYDLCFLHWSLEPALLQPFIPKGIELDLHHGQAWLGLVPFAMSSVKPRGMPFDVPPLTDFLEFNVRTYVRDREVSGVWFFSLDAAQWLAVRVARQLFHLPYFDARMKAHWEQGWCHYETTRTHPGQLPYHFRGKYCPAGEVFASQPGSLEEWLTERYWLFSQDTQGRLFRGRVHHQRWPLQRAEFHIESHDLEAPLGFSLGGAPQSALFCPSISVLADWLQPASPTLRLRS